MKECIICGATKELSEFYKHKQMSGGRTNKCKSCTKRQVKERADKLSLDPEWATKEKERSRLKYHRLEYKNKYQQNPGAKKATMNRYKEKYPEKIAAKNKSSRLKAKIKGNHLHHWSYNEDHFKDVIELSVLDHNKIHRHTIYDQERKMYRTTEGVLLDTKEDYLAYSKQVFNLLV